MSFLKHGAVRSSQLIADQQLQLYSKNFLALKQQQRHRQPCRPRSTQTMTSEAAATPISTISASQPSANLKEATTDTTAPDIRKSIAPWIKIGQFNSKLLGHLSLFDIFRSLAVLHSCSYDFIVDRSVKLCQLAQKTAPFGTWILRKTFFRQFIGGEKVEDMTKVVQSMQKRGLTVMMVSVLEEDVEDAPQTQAKLYDNNLNALLEIMDMVSAMEKNKPIMQLKPTTLVPVQTLENISPAILNYSSITDDKGMTNLIEQIAAGIENPAHFPLKLSKVDEVNYLDGLRRADLLIQKAKERSIHILIDAEFHSCKPSISMMAQVLMARHNQRNHWVGNTIQGYFKEAYPTIKTELEVLTKNLGVNWFGKIVRGAYIDRERLIAQKRGIPSPVWDTYDQTSDSYNKVVQHVLEHLAEQQRSLATTATSSSTSHLVVASHNEKSIRLAAQKMKELQIEPTANLVSFAQIYGMADYLSTPLVHENYRVYKSTPYGPLNEVFQYLSRRASENRAVIKGAREEVTMLKKELKSRLVPFTN